MTLSTLAVTGTVEDAGLNACAGDVIFTPYTGITDALGNPVPAAITGPADMIVVPMGGVSEPLASGGTFSTDLIPTDTPGLSPSGWAYQITISVTGVPDYTFIAFIPASPFTFSATQAAPAVFTAAGSAYASGAAVTLSGSSLPGGFSAGVTYYVTGVTGDTFSLAASGGGPALASTAAGSGTVSTASLDLSQLVPVTISAGMGAYLPLAGGTMTGRLTIGGGLLIPAGAAAGDVLTSDADGNAAWQPLGEIAGDKNYTQEFSSADVITVTHNLGKYPSVAVLDSAGDVMVGDIQNLTVNQLVVTFTAPTSGTVTCN